MPMSAPTRQWEVDTGMPAALLSRTASVAPDCRWVTDHSVTVSQCHSESQAGGQAGSQPSQQHSSPALRSCWCGGWVAGWRACTAKADELVSLTIFEPTVAMVREPTVTIPAKHDTAQHSTAQHSTAAACGREGKQQSPTQGNVTERSALSSDQTQQPAGSLERPIHP
jgi:hypothetical protein